MEPTPENALTWWGVVENVGLPGVLLAQVALFWWLIRKYVPVALKEWGEWILAVNELNKNLAEIKEFCKDVNTKGN